MTLRFFRTSLIDHINGVVPSEELSWAEVKAELDRQYEEHLALVAAARQAEADYWRCDYDEEETISILQNSSKGSL